MKNNYKGFQRGDALITPTELKQLIDDQDPDLVVIVLARFDQVLFKGAIPTAQRLWRHHYTIKEEKHGIDGMLCSAKQFEQIISSLGITNKSKIVIYDHKFDATRLWWAFYHFGITNSRVLDGGINNWKAAGSKFTVTRYFPKSKIKTSFKITSSSQGHMLANMKNVEEASCDVSQKEIQLWDTREVDEWSGKTLKYQAYRKGRIPNAQFLSWKHFRKDGGEFYNANAINTILSEVKMDRNKIQIFYCQSGVRTTIEIFALYLLGWPVENLLNYDGSWIEWSYYQQNPIE